MTEVSRFSFDPMIGWPWLAALGALALALWVLYVTLRGKAWLMRALALSVLALALSNPIWIQEEREPLKDVVAVVVDRSESMQFRGRTETAEAAFNRLKSQIEADETLELRLAETDPAADGTDLYAALQSALSDTARDRIAGAILITDGQAHDIPETPEAAAELGPIHGLIVGGQDEIDRSIEIQSAPSFGIVDSKIELRVQVDDPTADQVDVRVSVNGEPRPAQRVTVGQPSTFSLDLEGRGDNLVVLQVEGLPNELTLANNLASALVSGVQDRLRVLLVTGEPHAGARVWRDLLKSDPSVDLVHFTILRPPQKSDSTPTEEIALIAFPRAQLFRDKLDEFELVIFDHELRAGVMEMQYLDRVARYVERGGALMIAAGPPYDDADLLYNTPLGAVLPGSASGQMVETTTAPQLTDLGRRHSVTATLPVEPEWGPWLRYMKTDPGRADVVLQSGDGSPLLLLDRVNQGRVAVFTSDQIWLWARGYEGGGPYAEMIRRTAHWLMKEPELEEEFLQISTSPDGALLANLRTLSDDPAKLEVLGPDGQTQSVDWKLIGPGIYEASANGGQLGLYTARSSNLKAVAVRGPAHPREYQDLKATGEKIQPLATATLGGVFTIGADGSPNLPELRRVGERGNAAGDTWMGLRERGAYAVRATNTTNLIPGVVGMAIAALFMMLAWRREGR